MDLSSRSEDWNLANILIADAKSASARQSDAGCGRR
jgi:hypothetical protein